MGTASITPATTATTATTRLLRALAWIVPAAILVQAGLAGPAQFGRPELFELHGFIGSGVFVAAVVLVLLTFVARETWTVRIGALAVTGGLAAQLGLGYVGRRGGLSIASALHVPVGVALLGLAVAIAVLVTVRTPGDHAAGDTAADAAGGR